jgi:hypothetical protein
MNFPYLQGPRGAMFLYLVCCACLVNLPPAACRVRLNPYIHIRTTEVATSEVGRLCVLAIAYVFLT